MQEQWSTCTHRRTLWATCRCAALLVASSTFEPSFDCSSNTFNPCPLPIELCCRRAAVHFLLCSIERFPLFTAPASRILMHMKWSDCWVAGFIPLAVLSLFEMHKSSSAFCTWTYSNFGCFIESKAMRYSVVHQLLLWCLFDYRWRWWVCSLWPEALVWTSTEQLLESATNYLKVICTLHIFIIFETETQSKSRNRCHRWCNGSTEGFLLSIVHE